MSTQPTAIQPQNQPYEIREIPGAPGYGVDTEGMPWTRWKKRGRGRGNGIRGSEPFLSDGWVRMIPVPNGYGYYTASIKIYGKIKKVKLNVLVLRAFVGEKPTPKHESAHENGIRHDNRLSNLSWKTRPQNFADKECHGTHQFGEQNHQKKLTEDQVIEIRGRLASGEKGAHLAIEYGVCDALISMIKNRRRWGHPLSCPKTTQPIGSIPEITPQLG